MSQYRHHHHHHHHYRHELLTTIEPEASAVPLRLCVNPDVYIIIRFPTTDGNQADFHLLGDSGLIAYVSPVLANILESSILDNNGIDYDERHYPFASIELSHESHMPGVPHDSIRILFQVIHFKPQAFPNIGGMSFVTLCSIVLFMKEWEIDFRDWFMPQFEYYKPKRLEYGHEAWLFLAKEFQFPGDYSKLVAKLIVTFTGWKEDIVTGSLTGPVETVGLGSKERPVLEKQWIPYKVRAHMESEYNRLLDRIIQELDTWARNIHVLRQRRDARCTCSPVEDCVLVARSLLNVLEARKLVQSGNFYYDEYHDRSDYNSFRSIKWHGSILDLRKVLSPAENRLYRTLDYRYGRCKIYDSMTGLIRNVDETLKKIQGLAVDEMTVEVFNLEQLVGQEVAVPWTTGQLGALAAAGGLVCMVIVLVGWNWLKYLLVIACDDSRY